MTIELNWGPTAAGMTGAAWTVLIVAAAVVATWATFGLHALWCRLTGREDTW